MHIADFERCFDAGINAMTRLSMVEARRYYDRLCASFAAPLSPQLTLTDDTLVSGTGPALALRRFRPDNPRPGKVLYLHGGGFSLGSLDSHQGVAAGLAEALNREVVSLGYRLSPAATYADAIDDARRGIAALSPVAVVGDSAGGRLAIDAIEDAPGPVLGLIYPLVGRPELATLGPDAPLLSRADILVAWNAIAAHAPAGNGLEPPAASIEVLAVERDPLTAPLDAAVTAWKAAGADVGYHLAADMLHGSLHARESLPQMRKAWHNFCAGLRQRLD